jgi:DNA invertase Pin-like site-specific DNA recombinase
MNAIYIRTSTEDQNPENQLKGIYTLGVDIETDIYEDKQSAWKDDKERESFKKVIKLIKTNKIKDLYVWDWDRLYRNRLKLKEFFALCKMYKVNVHSANQSWYESINKIPEPFNEIMIDLMINLLGWMAEDESTKKSKRIIASTRVKDGVTISYKGNKWGRKSLSTQIRNKVVSLHKEGMSIRNIANSVKTTDKNNNQKNISVGAVHKLVAEFKAKNSSLK